MDARAILVDKKQVRVFSAELAKVIGLNESIFLQQLHYWLTKKEEKQDSRTVHDGYTWYYCTQNEWKQQFPFWSVSTIKRIITNLRKNNYIIIENHNRKGYDKTNWFRINYQALEDIPAGQNELVDGSDIPKGQFEPMEVTGDNIPSGQNEPMREVQNEPIHEVKMNQPIPKISTEISLPQNNDKRERNEKDVSAHGNQNRFVGLENDYQFRRWQREVHTAMSQIYCTLNEDDVLEVILYFVETYNECTGEVHPHFTQTGMIKVIEKFQEQEFDVNGRIVDVPFDVETYKELIDRYFDTEFYGADYKLWHFLSGNIRAYRQLEIYNQAV